MARFVAVPLTLERRPFRDGPYGIVDEIRRAVERTKRAHPVLAHCRLADVALKKRGDRVQVTLYFAP